MKLLNILITVLAPLTFAVDNSAALHIYSVSLSNLTASREKLGLLPPDIKFTFLDTVLFNVSLARIQIPRAVSTYCYTRVNSTAPYDLVRTCNDKRFFWEIIQTNVGYIYDDFTLRVTVVLFDEYVQTFPFCELLVVKVVLIMDSGSPPYRAIGSVTPKILTCVSKGVIGPTICNLTHSPLELTSG
jgi:hypothetical protein